MYLYDFVKAEVAVMCFKDISYILMMIVNLSQYLYKVKLHTYVFLLSFSRLFIFWL
jgi:hypothetical protein